MYLGEKIMILEKTKLGNVYIVEPSIFNDERGVFVKNFQEEIFKGMGLERDFKESFYSVSKRGVIRGMHFQVPPYDHAKLVYVVYGSITDVVLDIRRNSPSYGEYISLCLSSENKKSVYVGHGFAHGFSVESDYATVIYMQTAVYSPECDTGIRWDSFGMKWAVDNPILSKRDKNFLPFKDLVSPFLFEDRK